MIRDEYKEYSDARKYVETINVYFWDKLLARKTLTRDEVLVGSLCCLFSYEFIKFLLLTFSGAKLCAAAVSAFGRHHSYAIYS